VCVSVCVTPVLSEFSRHFACPPSISILPSPAPSPAQTLRRRRPPSPQSASSPPSAAHTIASCVVTPPLARRERLLAVEVDEEEAAAGAGRDATGAQVTCFKSTKAQILTPEELEEARHWRTRSKFDVHCESRTLHTIPARSSRASLTRTTHARARTHTHTHTHTRPLHPLPHTHTPKQTLEYTRSHHITGFRIRSQHACVSIRQKTFAMKAFRVRFGHF
jgi:hypothetical protein